MKNKLYLFAIFLMLLSCKGNYPDISKLPKKEIKNNLPIIGLLIYEGVLITEVTATADVFTKKTHEGKQLFNIIVIAEKLKPVFSEEGIAILPVITFVEDGKFSSSNGNLASYISALNLLEKMTNHEHRIYVESYLYLDRLTNWKN